MNKIPDLQALVSVETPDILCITESWLSTHVDNACLALSSYVIFRQDRAGGNDPHGGVLLCVKPFLNPSLIRHSTNHEVVFAEITTIDTKITIAGIYRTPNMSAESNFEFVQFIRQKLHNTRDYLLLGDFNYPGIDWDTYSSNERSESLFLEFVNENNLIQKVRIPTRGTNILDLCLTTSEHVIRDLEVCQTFSTSDHCYFRCNLIMDTTMGTEETYCAYSKADWDCIRMYFACIDWLEIFDGSLTCTMMWQKFKHIIDDCVSLFVPSLPVKQHGSKPWFNYNLWKLTQQKKNKWRSYKTNPSRRKKREYNAFCRSVKRKIAETKSLYEKKLFHDKKYNPKQFYNYIRNINNTKGDSHIPPLKNADGSQSITKEDKAETLSSQYASVYTVDNGLLPPCRQRAPVDSLSTLRITSEDLVVAFRSLNPNGSPGFDKISPRFLKEVSCYLILPLKILFQKSLDTSEIPDDWRTGIIVPIHKKNKCPNSPSSYRPICLTSAVSKLFEKIIHKYILSHFREHDVITSEQHGFLQRRSTTTNLLECMNDWTTALDNRTPVDVVYIDVARAFDSVSTSKLSYKFQKSGIGDSLLSWMEIFIGQRSQCVKVENYMSPFLPVGSGIGQGTILGPLLFLLFINDVHDCIQPSSTVKLFADDAKVYGFPNETNNLQTDLDNVAKFLSDWQLKINLDKCEVIHLGNKNVSKSYSIDGSVIPTKTSVRDLGIKVSSDLKPRNHITEITRISFFKLRQFHFALSCKERNFQLEIYCLYVRPLLEHNTPIWSPHLICDIDSIERVQRFFTKRLSGLWDTPYLERLRVLQLETLEHRRIINDLVFMYKLVNQLIDVDVQEFFTFNSNSTRGHSAKVNHQFSRLDCRKHFFVNRVTPMWNSLNNDIVQSDSIFAFKTKLKTCNFDRFCRGRAHTAT